MYGILQCTVEKVPFDHKNQRCGSILIKTGPGSWHFGQSRSGFRPRFVNQNIKKIKTCYLYCFSKKIQKYVCILRPPRRTYVQGTGTGEATRPSKHKISSLCPAGPISESDTLLKFNVIIYQEKTFSP
jgi:hypothetical protein